MRSLEATRSAYLVDPQLLLCHLVNGEITEWRSESARITIAWACIALNSRDYCPDQHFSARTAATALQDSYASHASYSRNITSRRFKLASHLGLTINRLVSSSRLLAYLTTLTPVAILWYIQWLACIIPATLTLCQLIKSASTMHATKTTRGGHTHFSNSRHWSKHHFIARSIGSLTSSWHCKFVPRYIVSTLKSIYQFTLQVCNSLLLNSLDWLIPATSYMTRITSI